MALVWRIKDDSPNSPNFPTIWYTPVTKPVTVYPAGCAPLVSVHMLKKVPNSIRPLIVNFMFQIRKISYDYVGGWLITHYSLLQPIATFNDRKVDVVGSIFAICHGNKVVLVLQQ